MLKFQYYVKDFNGSSRKGLVEAADKGQAARILKERGFVVISLKLKSDGAFAGIKRKLFGRVGINEVVNFTRQLATMINAGLVITDSLTILKSQTDNPGMVAVIDSIQKDIEGGSGLSEALGKHPAVFDIIYTALVRAGETAGVLDKILARLADNLEKQRAFINKVKGAMIYPVIIITGMAGVGGVMMIFVIPKLLDLYKEFDAEMPMATTILMAISNFITEFWWVTLLVLVGAVLGLRSFAKTEYGRIKIDLLFNSIPIVGKLRKAMMLTEFSRTLGLLVGGGVLLVDALRVSSDAVKSAVYKEAIMGAAIKVESKGSSLAVSLAEANVFPALLPQMISVGEETGKLDEVLLKLASYFEQEADTAVNGLTTAVEPIIMVVLGLGVGFLIIAVIMPIYNLTSQF